jgi:hypothetical protein
MLLIIAISIILLLPILSYLLHPLSTQKSTVFLISFFLFGGFVLNFQSTNSLIGSWVQATHSGSITKVISRNGQLESNILNRISRKSILSRGIFFTWSRNFLQGIGA